MISMIAALCLASAPVDASAHVVSAEGTAIAGARVDVWDSSFAVDGVAFDPDGVARIWNPVVGVTDAKGAARFSVPRPNNPFSSGKLLAVAVTAEGFAPFFRVVEVANGRLDIGEVKLERASEVTVSCGLEGVSVQLSMGRDVRNSSTGKDGNAVF